MEDEHNIYEKRKGYHLKNLDYREEIVKNKFFSNAKMYEEKQIKDELEVLSFYLNKETPKLMIQYIPSLNKMTKEERHKIIKPIADKWLKASNIYDELTWDENNKPTLNSPKDSISISHSNSYLFMQNIEGDAGCDIDQIVQHSTEEWGEILTLNKANYQTVIEQFQENGDNKDVAGTRLWSIQKSIYKAIGYFDGEIELKFMQDGLAVVAITQYNQTLEILSISNKTERGSHFILAYISKGKN